MLKKLFLVGLMLTVYTSAQAMDIRQLMQSDEFASGITTLSKYIAKKKDKSQNQFDVNELSGDDSSGSKGIGLLKKLINRGNSAQNISTGMTKSAQAAYFQNVQQSAMNGIQSIIVNAGPNHAYSLQMNHATQMAIISEYTQEGSNQMMYGQAPVMNTKQAQIDYNQATQLAFNLGVPIDNGVRVFTTR